MHSKILLLDIETSPNIGYTWGKWEVDVIEFIQNWHLLSFSYKWLGGKTEVRALPDYPCYKAGSDDKNLIKDLWKLLDEAEIVVAQNGDKFDIRKINTRFLHFKMSPPSPYRTVDTLKIARKHFAFNSNKLNDISQDLGEGEKFKHEGFGLWKGCMAGDKRSWDLMKKYNKQDVELLEKAYRRFLPFAANHPNMAVYSGEMSCSKCGSSRLQARGEIVNRTSQYQRWQCMSCGGWSKSIKGNRIAKFVNA